MMRVNYAALNVEEFGSVYEGLLEYYLQKSWMSMGGWNSRLSLVMIPRMIRFPLHA